MIPPNDANFDLISIYYPIRLKIYEDGGSALGATTASWTIIGGTLDLNGNSLTVDSLSGTLLLNCNLRIVALVARILLACFLVLDLLYILLIAVQFFTGPTGPTGYPGGYSSSYPASMFWSLSVQRSLSIAPLFTPFTILLAAFLATYILTALSEILSCQATLASEPSNR